MHTNFKLICSVILSIVVLLSSPLQAATQFISPKPLAQALADVKVGNVRATDPVQVPFITWGGDIATILANGNQRRTASSSVMAQEGLSVDLVREDVFTRQLEAYMSGRSPYLRGTMGMISMASDLLARDERTKPVVIYQMTWSAGGDALVVKPGIHSARELRGKTIALQAYGPHVDYMSKILADAGLKISDVKLKWVSDLTGSENSPAVAFEQNDVDAAFVIIPDALLLTSGGAVGTGAEGSVRGAKIMLSTKTANRIIADVYAVRSDYFKQNPATVEAFVRALLRGEEQLRKLFKSRSGSAYKKMLGTAAGMLLDSEQATADTEGLYADAEFVGLAGNAAFFNQSNYPRSFARLSKEIQSAMLQLGLIQRPVTLADSGWQYQQLGAGLSSATAQPAERFDEREVAAVVATRQRQDTLGEGELFSFEIFFQPNQNSFSADLYNDSFDKVIELASTYGGALITVEGHSDPMGYLRKKKKGESELVLGRVKQSAKNLSLTRAIAVRDSIIDYANAKGISLDRSQFAVLGHGIAKPKNGVCGQDPCAPKTEQQWRDNMRVQFRLIQVEAESNVFKPL